MRVGRLITIIMLTIFFTLLVNNFVSACIFDTDCSYNQICDVGVCVNKLCTSNSMCDSDEICNLNTGDCELLDCVSSHTDSSCYVKPVGHECVNCETSGKVCNSAGTACVACVPDTCSELGFECGVGHDDGCSNTISYCGTSGGTCDYKGDNYVCNEVTYRCECVPDTCASLGYECGSWSDGCGGTVTCGSCPLPVNGGAPVCTSEGVCDCVPFTSQHYVDLKKCGVSITDGCDFVLSVPCPDPYVCSTDVPGVVGTCSCGNLTTCASGCVDTNINLNNCGGCSEDGGKDCSLNLASGVVASCVGGECVYVCDEGSFCDGQCVDLNTDSSNCGSCGNDCGVDVCVSGVCQTDCGSLDLCDGSCVNLNTDVDNCGFCGNVCETIYSNDVVSCVQGSCVVSCVPDDFKDDFCTTQTFDDGCGNVVKGSKVCFEVCNGVDDNYIDGIDEGGVCSQDVVCDLDKDLVYATYHCDDFACVSRLSQFSCKLATPVVLDCDDDDLNINPNTKERCDNGLDDDCDGLIDDFDSDCNAPICEDGVCVPYSVEEVTQLFVSCDDVRLYWNITYSDPYCGPSCGYNKISKINYKNESVYRPDGQVCEDGVCVGGVCLPLCEQCAFTLPENAVLKDGYCDQGVCFGCFNDYLLEDGKCVDKGYQIILDDVIMTEGDSITLTPKTKKYEEIEATYKYEGVVSGTKVPIVLSPPIGIHELKITAYKLNVYEEPVASKTISVVVTCKYNNPCCEDTSFKQDGASCTINDNPGVCRNKECIEQSLLVPEGAKYNNCDDGIDNDRDGVYDCVTINGKTETDCNCDAYCEPTEISCGPFCVDTTSNQQHCGACNNACDSNQQCINSKCEYIEDCFVACLDDNECAQGQVCINAGECDAFCDTTDQIIINETETMSVLTNIVKFGAVNVELEADEKMFMTVTNLINQPIQNVTITLNLPSLMGKASNIQSSYDFSIIQEEPGIIEVFIPELEKEIISYKLTRDADPELINQIKTSVTYDLVNLAEIQPLKKEELQISTNFKETKEGTKVTLQLLPGQKLKDVKVPLEIPKCLANSISEMDFEQDNYVVVHDDPLMVWSFATLEDAESIEFTIPKSVDKDCQDQLKAFGLSNDKGSPVKPWMLMTLIPIIGLILVFFHRFSEYKGAETHLTKSEFYKLAKEQGEIDIDRAWHDYKRKW